MEQIPAWQAEDGKKFFDDEECLAYEKTASFRTWFIENPIGSPFKVQPDNEHLRHWLTKHAEDIRGFLPPVAAKPELPNDVLSVNQRLAAKPELDIEVLQARSHQYSDLGKVVPMNTVVRWLAGELK